MEERFFSKVDWSAFWTATIVTFAVYFFTLGPSVGLEDSGELATAAASLGVPHPPGYPFWTFCSWIFCKLFGWVTYMGHPTPAWAVSLCSATFGAFAAGCTAMLICRSAIDFVGSHPKICFSGAVGAALSFAFSPVEWSQSTIVEVYSLNSLFLSAVFLLSYRWMRKPSDKILFITAFVFGLGLTNYQVLLLAIAPLAIIIALKNLALFRDVFLYLVPVGMTWQILQIGALDRATHLMSSDVINKHKGLACASVPSSTLLVISVVLIIAAILIAIYKKNAKSVIILGASSIALMLINLHFVDDFLDKVYWDNALDYPLAPLIDPKTYAYIVMMVMGSVITAVLNKLKEDKRYLIVSGVFAVLAILIALSVPSASSAGYYGPKFPWGKSTFMFIVMLALLFTLAHFSNKAYNFAIPVAGLHIAAFILLSRGAMNGLTHPVSWWFWWPILWNFVVLALVYLMLPNGRSVSGAAFFCQLGVAFYVYMPIVSDLRNPAMNWGYARTWEGFKHAILRGQYEAIGIQPFKWGMLVNYISDLWTQFGGVLFALFGLPLGVYALKKEENDRRNFLAWMIPLGVCFLLMSVLLILLANVKGDIQDGFIQKVKFISSHAMLAIWIGYGMIFASLAIIHYFKTERGKKYLEVRGLTLRHVAYLLSVVMILFAGLTPIVRNYTNDRLVFEQGGAEQNGHTFGWQFGAFSLNGEKAIKEMLDEDEEPLPDPGYPPAMTKSALFFGGTDPGRFVPTYMIFSADYRPDIYIITQNALADDTYMSVERDHYGDEIWIPSKDDSSKAFAIYVDEVERGVRKANGDLRTDNGRVQVTGALGVMEINGILTKMMFEHEKNRRDFYIEESYAIPWMYEYLSPHGLIMKINAEKTPYDAKLAAKDRDFWDWYTRRLLNDKMYRRDFAGQKSFSKLRASLAGLYNRQRKYRESAQAYRESCLLYPASPEATFRYAQDYLIPYRKWNITLELMDYTDFMDPKNRRTTSMRSYVLRFKNCLEAIETLGEKARKGEELSSLETLTLANSYFSLGKFESAEALLVGYLRRYPTESAEAWSLMADLQEETGRKEAAEKSRYVAERILNSRSK